MRSTELRICGVELDQAVLDLLALDEDQVIRLVAHRPRDQSVQALDTIDAEVRAFHMLSAEERIFIFEVHRSDASEFEETLKVTSECIGRHVVLKASSPAIANSIAALLIYLEKTTGKLPHAYFKWTEGNPVANVFRFLFFGGGDVAPVTHEVLRRAVKDPEHRPVIHVA